MIEFSRTRAAYLMAGMGSAALFVSATGCATVPTSADAVYYPSPPSIARVVHVKSFNTLGELVPPRESWVSAFRGRPISPYADMPAGIAFRDGHLYVCDTGVNVVHDWDLTTGAANEIGLDAEGGFVKPVAVAVGADGTVYVADTGRAEVAAFRADGATLRRFVPEQREGFRPVAVAVDEQTLYVADIGSHVVHMFSTADGKKIGTIGAIGSGPGQFYFPMGLATDTAGNLFVSDMLNGRVHMFDRAHSLIRTMGRPGDRYGDFGKPKDVSVGPNGTVFVADAEFRHVHLLNRQGQLLLLIGGPQDEPGGTPMPLGVAVAKSLPERLASLVPPGFDARYYLFVTNSFGTKRISLFAVGASE